MIICLGTLPGSWMKESRSGCGECLLYDVLRVLESGEGLGYVIYFSSKMFIAA